MHVSGIGANTGLAFDLYLQPRRRGGGCAGRVARVMFAADDAFLTTILRLLRSLPAYPIFGDGRTKLQPVRADNVAAAIAQILQQSQKPYPPMNWPPRVYSYEELLRTIAGIAGLRPVLMRTPLALLLSGRRSRHSPSIGSNLCRSTLRPPKGCRGLLI